MKRMILILLVLGVQSSSFGQFEKGKAYVEKYKDIAINEMIRSGVPAAITLAQGILESQYGESDLCIQSNNHFGIKCKTEWTGDKVFHDDDTKHECFRSYPDAESSFRDHSDFLKNRPYYTNLFKLQPTDFKGWAIGLKKAGYATEKDYAQKLMKVINDYQLNQYTVIGLQLQTAKQIQPTAPEFQQTKTIQPEELQKSEAEEKEEVVFVSSKADSKSTENKPSSYPDGVFTINHTRVFFAREGISLLALANRFDISFSRLLSYNDMEHVDILNHDTLIFLEMKPKRSTIDYHVTLPGETLHQICQLEGIRLSALLQFNNLKPNMQPLPGEKIYLRAAAPITPKTVAIGKNSNNSSSE